MNRSHRKQAFTLIEILLVVGIMAMLAGVIGLNLRGTGQGARIKITKVTLANVKGALSEYDLEYHKLPESLDALVDPNKGPILDAETVPTDEWKNALRFKNEGGRLHVYSAGPDGNWGNADDLRTP